MKMFCINTQEAACDLRDDAMFRRPLEATIIATKLPDCGAARHGTRFQQDPRNETKQRKGTWQPLFGSNYIDKVGSNGYTGPAGREGSQGSAGSFFSFHTCGNGYLCPAGGKIKTR